MKELPPLKDMIGDDYAYLLKACSGHGVNIDEIHPYLQMEWQNVSKYSGRFEWERRYWVTIPIYTHK